MFKTRRQQQSRPLGSGPKPEPRSPKPEAHRQEPTRSAYVDGLTMLGRRELSESQLRQRLARKGHEPDAVVEAIERLKSERGIDDERTAAAIAHSEAILRHRGRNRVLQKIIQAGIVPGVAQRAIDAVFDEIDEDTVLETAVTRKLRGRSIASTSEFARVCRSLVGQGFPLDRVLRSLKRRRSGESDDPPESVD